MFDKKAYKKVLLEMPKGVKVMGVSKKKEAKNIEEAVNFGVKLIGENYVQEAEEKYQLLGQILKLNHVSFHLIGSLQSNKAKRAAKIFDCIQTIDSEKIARKINDACEEIGKKMDVMIEVNLGEEQKSGVSEVELEELVAKVKEMSNLNLIGLMCVPKAGTEEESFEKMRLFKEKFGLKELSMGMSADYKTAVKHGATIIRLGTILFGARD